MKKIILILIIFLASITNVQASELSCTVTLKKGMKGSKIELLQSTLNELTSCNIKVDGIYGADTTDCVLKFQKENKLTETGTVNKSTCNAINKKNPSVSTSLTLQKGSTGEEVKTLQTKLNEIMGCELKIDGIYGSKTEKCVSEFQAASNLTKTGIYNEKTKNTLEKINKDENNAITLQKGSTGELVKTLQKRLNKTIGCNLKIDGKYGNDTKSCVSKFQTINDLKSNGIFDSDTNSVLNKIENETANIKELKKGSTGEEVKILQTKLNKILNCNLTTDGKYGNLTKAYVMKYQINTNLEVTGTINPMTYYKLINQETPIEKELPLEITEKSLIVIKNSTLIKKSTSTYSETLKKVTFGEIYPYETTTKKDKTTWYKVKVDNTYGYIKSTDISTDFIVVDKSLQKLILYKNEEVILNTEVVTGMYTNHDTPTGYYELKTKNLQKGRTLRGYNDDGTKYASYVDYWMPFITSRGIGFHDATWRSKGEFTDTRYLYDGSHGCVNMKKEAAKTLFNNIDKDIDVIIRD